MDKKEKLEELKNKALKDDFLPLKSAETNLVFGVGNPDAAVLFLGEGPGYWENLKEEPFVGNAGLLLNRLLGMIDIKREDVYITNVVMHRPPGNRDPEADEIEAYKPYIDGIIEIINPKVVITLGRFSMAKFLPGATISSIHGKPREIEWKGKRLVIIPMYHPAAALRNGQIMQRIREDFLKVPDVLENIRKQKNDKIEKEETVEQMNLL
jgi:DNA polymerase